MIFPLRWKAAVLSLATVAVLFSAGNCSSFRNRKGDLGPGALNRAPSSLMALPNDPYYREIQPILSHRCVACHACVEAPCQLLISSYKGVERGGTKEDLNKERLIALPPTRLKDAKTLAEWRKRNYFSVLPSGQDKETSLIHHFLFHSQLRSQAGFSLDAIREYSKDGRKCVANRDEFEEFIAKYPNAGMPLGLPAIAPSEFAMLETWLADGAPGPSAEAQAELSRPSDPELVQKWESLLNQPGPKGKLSSRFIYEHMFSAHLHLEGTPDNEFFEIVRSRTAAPGPIDEIVTENAYDDPETPTFYYRLRKVTEEIVQKTHILWNLDDRKFARIRELFFETSWGSAPIREVDYEDENPFMAFAQIPAESRYRFMLENAEVLIDAMTRGPVCSGRTATYAIRDNFWIFFLDPKADVSVLDPSVGKDAWEPLFLLRKLKELTYNNKFEAAMRRLKPEGYGLGDIWIGDGHDPNAALTVLRHEESAAVYYGHIGGMPQTMWLLSFSNFERLYYNLVVEYLPWENVAHHMSTWNSMSRHRAEAEERFISLLPQVLRGEVRSSWNGGLSEVETIPAALRGMGQESRIQVDPAAPIESLVSQLHAGFAPEVLVETTDINSRKKTLTEIPEAIRSRSEWEAAFSVLTSRSDLRFPRFFPNAVFVRVGNEPWVYTVVSHRGYKYNNWVSMESLARAPKRDVIAVLPGAQMTRPELFFDVPLADASRFLKELREVASAEGFEALKNHFAVRRNSALFWATYDWYDTWMRRNNPLEAGIFDLSRYDRLENPF